MKVWMQAKTSKETVWLYLQRDWARDWRLSYTFICYVCDCVHMHASVIVCVHALAYTYINTRTHPHTHTYMWLRWFSIMLKYVMYFLYINMYRTAYAIYLTVWKRKHVVFSPVAPKTHWLIERMWNVVISVICSIFVCVWREDVWVCVCVRACV